MKFLYYFLILIFLYFVVVQYNDPDPYIWMAIYLFPVYLIFQKMLGKVDSKSLILVGISYFFWAIIQFPPSWEGILLNEMGMKTLNIELGRESLGLGFTAIVLLLISIIKN